MVNEIVGVTTASSPTSSFLHYSVSSLLFPDLLLSTTVQSLSEVYRGVFTQLWR